MYYLYERERKKSKSQREKKKKLTIIASLSRFYYIVHIITTTLVYSMSLINIAGIERDLERRNHRHIDIDIS
jgi:hypothetical protein